MEKNKLVIIAIIKNANKKSSNLLCVEMYCSQSLRQSSSDTFIMTATVGCFVHQKRVKLENSSFVFHYFLIFLLFFDPGREMGEIFAFLHFCRDTLRFIKFTE